MAINSDSFLNTPQAVDDFWFYTEDDLQYLGEYAQLILDVMANDTGGKAKTLFSIDDGAGNPISPTDLLNVDGLINGISAWETTSGGNSFRINNGKIELNLDATLAALGGVSINSLAAGDHIHDTFTYAIRLGNGTLSWASVTFDLYGQNDGATISGDVTGTLAEDETSPVTGTLTVVDPDHDESFVQSVVNGATLAGLGTYSVDVDGNWSYVVDNAAVQYLADGETASDSFSVVSSDGTASETVTITITGDNEAPTWQPRPVNAIVYGTTGFAHILSIAPDGSFTDTGISLSVGGQYAYGTFFGDINGDGNEDVAVTGDNGFGRIYYNNGDSTFTDSGALFPGSFQQRVGADDIDNDGDLDPYFVNGTGASIQYQNNGAAGFSQVFSFDSPDASGFYRTGRVALYADLNGDDFLDLYIPRASPELLADKIFFNDGTGHFTDSGIALPVGRTAGVQLGDVNNDGYTDIVRTPNAAGPAGVLLNDGLGNFSVHQATFAVANEVALELADVDSNGTLDAVTATSAVGNGGLQWWSNDGSGTFTLGGTIDAVVNGIVHLTLGDFSGDGYVDIIESDGGIVRTYVNDGIGVFTLSDSIALPINSYFFYMDAGLL